MCMRLRERTVLLATFYSLDSRSISLSHIDEFITNISIVENFYSKYYLDFSYDSIMSYVRMNNLFKMEHKNNIKLITSSDKIVEELNWTLDKELLNLLNKLNSKHAQFQSLNTDTLTKI